MSFECPYCKKEFKEVCEDLVYISCRNHPLKVDFSLVSSYDYNNFLNIEYVLMREKYDPLMASYTKLWNYQIFIEKDRMRLCKNYSTLNYLPLDKSLTPENFYQKLKTYLLFL